MKALLLCTADSDYCGAGQLNCFSEFINGSLADEINAFVDRYVDFDTQCTEATAYSVYDARVLAEKISRKYQPCRIIIISDIDDEPDTNGFDFIGYDVVADDNYTSPIGLDYLEMSMSEAEFTDDMPFFEELGEVRYDYANMLNEYMLFDDLQWAEELSEYCNYICEQYEGSFSDANGFRSVKIYINNTECS